MPGLLGGLALANAGLGAVHGFAAPLGGMFDAPHGALCAALLPHAMRVNIGAAASHPEILARFATVARILTGRPDSIPEDGTNWVAGLCRDLEIQPLRAYGVTAADVPAVAEKAAHASSMKANPVVLTQAQLENLLNSAL